MHKFTFSKLNNQIINLIQVNCCCKSTCATKRNDKTKRGCPCKARNMVCSANCKCGTPKNPCKNRVGSVTSVYVPQEVENKCCKLKNCITLSSQFIKLCLDTDVLQLCIRNTSDIRNDRKDKSTRAFRKAAYRQFILARHGYLGKGNRRVCPSCVVLKIRQRYPSLTGVYMGYRER